MNALVLILFYVFLTFSFIGCFEGFIQKNVSMIAIGLVCFFLMCLTSTFYESGAEKDGE